MNIPLTKNSIATGRQIDLLMLFRKGTWLAVLLVSIAYSLVATMVTLTRMDDGLGRWVYGYLNFLSFVLGAIVGAIIFFRKSNSWMAFATAIMLITFTSTGDGFDFWYLVLTGILSPPSGTIDLVPGVVSLFISVLFLALLTSSLTYVLLAFPDSKLTSRSAEAFFIVLIVTQVALVLLIGGISLITIFALKDARVVGYLILILDMVKSVLLIGLAIWQTIRRRRIIDPVKRQQVKWIGWSLTGMTIFYAVGMLISAWSGKWIPVGIFIALLVFTYAFIITLLIAIVRYRLWDTRLFVNKALFYGAVSTVLTAIGLTGVYFLELFGKQSMESDPRLGVGFLMLFMAAVFTPIRGRVQAIVDHYLKPEEVDFSSTLVELSPGSNLMLSSQDILRILVNQSIEQLELSGAAVHLRQQDGQLVQMEPAVPELQAPPIRLDDRVRKRLEKGEVVVPPDGSPLSLYVSLVVKRASRPHFLGVLVFGSRNSGEGYSTPVLKSLKKLGCDAGTAFYVAQLREHLGQNMMDRLAAIEKGLSLLNKPQASETSPVQ